MNSIQGFYEARSLLQKEIRDFFSKKNYLEVDTPIAVTAPGTELHLDYFPTTWTDYKGSEHLFWLRSSPELHMKQVLSQGPNKIFQLAKCFRNAGEYAAWHHPEFTMLEWYETDISFTKYMDQTENLLLTTGDNFLSKCSLKTSFTLPEKFERITVTQAFKEFASVDLIDLDPNLAESCVTAGISSVNASDDFETAFYKTLIDRVEPGLMNLKASVLYDYPESQAALSKIENGVAKRFEFYLGSTELSNGFLELLCPIENKSRIENTNKQRAELGKQEISLDKDFIDAMSSGIPDCCGNALGFDRWLALLSGQENLDKIIPFRNNAPFFQRPDF